MYLPLPCLIVERCCHICQIRLINFDFNNRSGVRLTSSVLTIITLICKFCQFFHALFPCRAHLAAQRGLQIATAKPSAAKASVWSGPLLQRWPASHTAMHLSPPLHLFHHTIMKASLQLNCIVKGPNGLHILRHHSCFRCKPMKTNMLNAWPTTITVHQKRWLMQATI